MVKGHVIALLAAVLSAAAFADAVVGVNRTYDEGQIVDGQDLVIESGAEITAPWFRFANTTGENTTHFTMKGGTLTATAALGKLTMPCKDVDYAFCLGYGPGYVIADLAGGEIDCPNGLFTVSRDSYTTCMCTGTVIRCRGFRLQADESSGYATFILGAGSELIVGDWGVRGFHDPKVDTSYTLGNKDFRYYFEMRGGKIRCEEDFAPNFEVTTMEHSPCLIMAPDTVSEFEVVEGKRVAYAGQLQGEGSLRKTGKGTLSFSSAYIANEGTIIVEEGVVEMYTTQAKSLFWGNVIVKSGAGLLLKINNPAGVPDEIEVCRSGLVTVEDGATVTVYNQAGGAYTNIDMDENTENGGYIESRSRYRLGVNMNTGTTSWTWNDDTVVVHDEDENVGGYPEKGSTWGATRELKLGGPQMTDIMRIYSRADISKYVRFAYWMGASANTACPYPFTNGNMRLTKRYFSDGIGGGTRNAEVVVVSNYLYTAETITLPAPPNERGWQMRLEDIPYAEFDLYLIYACNQQTRASTKFAPAYIRVTTPDGKVNSGWRAYSYTTSTVRSTENWGAACWCESTNMVEGVNYLKIHLSPSEAEAIGLGVLNDLAGVSIDVTHGPVSDDGTHQVRAGLAGFQIVPSGRSLPELDINEYTAFTANKNIYGLGDSEAFQIDFTSTNETSAIGFVHSISNDSPVASRILVNGKEFPRLPGEESRYRFGAVNSDKLQLDVKYLPWRDNQTNDLTLAQLAWVTNRWGEADVLNATPSNVALNAASAIEGADRDGDDFPFQFEYVTDSDLTRESNPMHLAIVGRAISNACLWLDVEYTRTEDGIAATNALGKVVPGWLGVTNGVDNPPYLQVGMKGGGAFSFAADQLKPFSAGLNRGVNPEFTTSITNTVSLPVIELTNRFFRAVMEMK